jgi:flagellar hook-basal body complex protein FliE
MSNPVNLNTALAAYNNAAKITGSGLDNSDVTQVGGQSFLAAINNSLSNSTAALKNVDGVVSKSLVKQADITDVVSAITSAELTLKTIIGIRDKLLAAHQEIMKMPI